MKYSIVIPTYNHCDDLLKPCVESILKYSNMAEVELIISANGCYDNTKQYLEQLRNQFDALGFEDNFKYCWHDEPLGYAKATNEGIKLATSDLIVLLNNDVVLLNQNKQRWLRQLESPFLTNEKCGISCLIKYFSEPAAAEFAIFFCVMIHRKVFDKIGLLSLDYGAGGGEDTEFSIECEKAGFEICPCVKKEWSDSASLFVGDFPIYHRGEGTVHDPKLVPNWNKIFLENSLTLARKYNPNYLTSDHQEIDLTFLKEQNLEVYDEIITNNNYAIDNSIFQNKIVIDVGANNGVFTLLAAKSKAKEILSYEPVNDTFELLSSNIQKLNLKNVKAFKKIVHKHSGFLKTINIQKNNAHNSLYIDSTIKERVETISLDDILKTCDGKVILKLDCEGSEYDILLGASYDEMQKVEKIILEIHADMHPVYKGFDILHDRLKYFGFKSEVFNQIYSWDTDAQGNVVNMKPIPCSMEVWGK